MDSIISIIKDLQNSRMVIVIDDENRENEGDIFFPSQMITPSIVNFLIREAKGLVCVAMEKEKLEKLNIPLMVENNEDAHQTNFTVSVDLKESKTGISAFERSDTIKALALSNNPNNFRRPGHIFPLQSHPEGLKKRRGHTEAAIALMKLSGLITSCVICEVINKSGHMSKLDDLMVFKKKHGIKICSIEEIIQYIKKNNLTV